MKTYINVKFTHQCEISTPNIFEKLCSNSEYFDVKNHKALIGDYVFKSLFDLYYLRENISSSFLVRHTWKHEKLFDMFSLLKKVGWRSLQCTIHSNYYLIRRHRPSTRIFMTKNHHWKYEGLEGKSRNLRKIDYLHQYNNNMNYAHRRILETISRIYLF